jgi:hypothetical protein
MELKVQTYLKNKVESGLSNLEALKELEKEFAIKVKLYEDPQDRFVLLNYDQTESPKAHPVVIECRSLILCLDTFNLVSKKFDRFFNLGECPEFYSDFSFQDSLVMEKVDGSLVGIYHHNGVWQISTRGMAKAEGPFLTGDTFRKKILEAFGFSSEEAFQKFFKAMRFNPRMTYVFEFASPENLIVTRYEKPQMVLLGIIDHDLGKVHGLETLQQLASLFVFYGFNVRLPKMYSPTKHLEQLVELANRLENLEEGFVVWDPKSDKRVKIKSKTYLVAHALKGENSVPTEKNILELVLEGEDDEFLAYFPEWKEKVESARRKVSEFENNLNQAWEQVKHISDQKTFALKVKDLPGSGFLFEAKKKGLSPVQVFHQADLGKRLRILGV